MADRSDDWMAQARRDLEHAARVADLGFSEHACFGAQQAAEKAVKAVYQRRHAEGWGHRVSKLLQDLPSVGLEPAGPLVDDAKLLDQYYVPTRYPNGFESGAPMDFYTMEQARDAVRRAQDIIAWCESILRGAP